MSIFRRIQSKDTETHPTLFPPFHRPLWTSHSHIRLLQSKDIKVKKVYIETSAYLMHVKKRYDAISWEEEKEGKRKRSPGEKGGLFVCQSFQSSFGVFLNHFFFHLLIISLLSFFFFLFSSSFCYFSLERTFLHCNGHPWNPSRVKSTCSLTHS